MLGVRYNWRKDMEYKGYEYGYWDDVEEDNIKRFHEVKTPEGKSISMPIGPYQRSVSQQTFERWIDMGMPTRQEIGGHYQDDHDKYYEKWVTEQLEDELELKASTNIR